MRSLPIRWLAVPTAALASASLGVASLAAPPPADITTLGADTTAFIDMFVLEEGWGTSSDDRGSVAYAQPGVLIITVKAPDRSRWSWRNLADSHPVERVEASVSLGDSAGAAGVMCGTEATVPDFLFGLVSTENEWIVGRIVGSPEGSRISVLDRGALTLGTAGPGALVPVAVECAQTGPDTSRVVMWVAGTPVGDASSGAIAPFSRAALYADDRDAPFTATFDNVSTKVGDSYAPSPSASPQAGASPAPSGGEPVTLGADTEVISDTFDDETLWGTGTLRQGNIEYGGGRLKILATESRNGLWTYRGIIGDPKAVMRVEASVTLEGEQTVVGLMCGTDASHPDFLLATVNSIDQWAIAKVVSSATTILAQGALPAGVVASDGSARLAVECAVTPDGTDHIALWVDGRFAGELVDAPHIGPYARFGAYALTEKPPAEVSFDDALVLVGEEYAPGRAQASPGPSDTQAPASPDAGRGEELLARVPSAFRDACTVLPIEPDQGETGAVACSPAGDVDGAQYYLYDSNASMDASFDDLVASEAGDPSGSSCKTEASVLSYTIDGQPAGRLACFPDPDSPLGKVITWTDDQLSIMVVGTDAAMDYADLYAWWRGAGPDR